MPNIPPLPDRCLYLYDTDTGVDEWSATGICGY